MHIVLARPTVERTVAIELDDDANEFAEHEIAKGELAHFVAEAEKRRPRWVWNDTRAWYPSLLAEGVRVDRCVDLSLSHRILRLSTLSARSELALAPPSGWDAAATLDEQPGEAAALFDLHPDGDAAEAAPDAGSAAGPTSVLAEFRLQQAAVAGSQEPGRLRLLLAAESAGALIAAEMQYAGLPWRSDLHDALLSELLGPRPMTGARPAKLEALAGEVRSALGAPSLNPDSQADLLRALRRAGLVVTSTRSWELKKVEHPVIAPLLEYKKLSRLASANGWAWMDSWIRDGRFHPDYIPGGVVTGRWATKGGGALQLPRQVRGAVVADPGWKLVVADAAQLEPRILTGLSADTAMAAAGRGKDLYEGIVASGAVDERAHAKVAMLGAMYGATTGESGRLMPRLARAFPKAIRMVEEAARAGERGDVVTSRLGRSSPRPGAAWLQTQGSASAPDSTEADERRARSQARDWGRFTRNFVVQASAAEWALCWMAELRKRLDSLTPPGSRIEHGPHLVYFLHDEVIVHAPEDVADDVADTVAASAREAGRLLFGAFPVDFPVTTAVVDTYAEAK
ncbi:bifunctional 3'-5' exonuclease/DNA polymerase [Diaminobutyricibacter tongyongensis]|uniref:DNA-directed DNA polymerase n=1 Tax=Leifsonia tongyongensis TaxID=1268043 RepID=A0A6L9XZK2_9MICO|nr:bifunctional 3'-5' exonuclease/DNA polymerase [Diaminobutyricibacter tongyongensis]